MIEQVRRHLVNHFSGLGLDREPETASVTFLGLEPVDVLRFGPDAEGVYHFVSLGCSRHPMTDPTATLVDPTRGPRAEVMVSLRAATPAGLARSIAVVAAAPAVEGLVLTPEALVDLSSPVWAGAPFTAMLLGTSAIGDISVGDQSVAVLAAVPVTATEAAWVRLKGADALREAWRTDGVDIYDTNRPAAQPK